MILWCKRNKTLRDVLLLGNESPLESHHFTVDYLPATPSCFITVRNYIWQEKKKNARGFQQTATRQRPEQEVETW